MPDPLAHPVAALTSYELRDRRALLSRQLRQMRDGDPGRAGVQQQLQAVIAEQNERAEARRSQG